MDLLKTVKTARNRVFKHLPEPFQLGLRRLMGKERPWGPGPGPKPPVCPPGMVVGPPDFVGVGTQKSGTTWWMALISDHPGVYRPEGVRKELHFFKDFWSREFDQDSVAEYHQWFPRPEGLLAGEWTPGYLAQFWLPPLLHMAAPDTKLLVLLRDPVDRYQSGLTHYTARRRHIDGSLVIDTFERGFYARQLERLERWFSPDQILVLQYERCAAEPEAMLRDTYSFLGLDTSHRPAHLTSRVHATRIEKVSLPQGLTQLLVDLYSEDVASLAKRYPAIDLALWPHFQHLR